MVAASYSGGKEKELHLHVRFWQCRPRVCFLYLAACLEITSPAASTQTSKLGGLIHEQQELELRIGKLDCSQHAV